MQCFVRNISKTTIKLRFWWKYDKRDKCKKYICDRSISTLADMVKGRKRFGGKTYEDAICTLNGLQTNAEVIAQMRKEKGSTQRNSLPEMEMYLQRLNINVCDIDQLNVIHVSGTKGKGSVSAFCESILRHTGLHTGFYSSPHLLEVRERIRIGGKPLRRESFATYFFECYDALMSTADEHNDEMPGYFRFLTLMAYYVFLQEKLDVVIMEVGIGGTYDCTNIVKNPVVSGICKLELDHTALLGNTIEQIAWHKAGIMKPGHPALTLPQVEAAEKVLFERARELKTTLYIVPPLSAYEFNSSELKFNGEHQKINAALALQLCRLWFHERQHYISEFSDRIVSDDFAELQQDKPYNNADSKDIQVFNVPDIFIQGLTNTSWAGRCQVIQRKSITFYIDGAHTPGSIQACVDWVNSRIDTDIELPRHNIFRVLLFNVSGDRDEAVMLQLLQKIGFDHAVFCPSILETKLGESTADTTNFNLTRDCRLRLCDKNQKSWLRLNNITYDTNSDQTDSSSLEPSNISTVFPNVSSAVRWIANGRDSEIGKPEFGMSFPPKKLVDSTHIQVVVTGSLHLVGGVIRLLRPNICDIFT